jgi:replicative DNA helicase
LILGDTGVGKTALLLNLAYSQAPKPVLFFELELSPEDMAERFVARDQGMTTFMVNHAAQMGRAISTDGWGHVFICPLSTMTTEKMESVIIESELKIGQKPALVLLDYVGLVQGGGDKRYERMSTIAEDLKRLARSTKTVIFIASQVKRDEGQEIGLHSAKDSGSLENSAQIVLGATRTQKDEIKIKILKQTRQTGKPEIYTHYDGDRQTITELETR